MGSHLLNIIEGVGLRHGRQGSTLKEEVTPANDFYTSIGVFKY